MGRLSAIFVAICMVLIAFSIGAVLYLGFGLSGPESAIVALTALTGLALYNAVTTRFQDRGDFSSQIGDLAGGIADLARQVSELNRRVAAIENKAQAAVETTLAATQPINAEIGEVGGLIKQIAETVAAHDTQLRVLTPAAGSAVAGVDALPAALSPQATAPKRPEPPPIPPLIAALPVESAEAKPDLASDANQDAKPDATPIDTKAAESAPLAAAPLDPAVSAPAAAIFAAAEPSAADVASSEATPMAPAPAEAPAVAPASTRIQAGRFKDMEPAAVIEKIREAVEANRVDLFLQPIVTLPQRKVRYYEAVARLRVGDGDPLMAADFLSYAEQGGLMPKIDNLMMFRCVQVVRRLLAKNREIGLFCNISASTLADGATFPQFCEFMEANKAIAPALVFEFTQAAARAMGPIENESLAALRERGYRFSLDNVTDLRIEPRDLAERGFRFLKVQSSLLLNRTGVALSDIHPQDFASLLSRYGIELIAARIESEASVVDLLDYDVKLAQGFLFSPPRPVRPEVVQGAGDRADAAAREKIDAPPPASEAAAAAQRISLAQLARGVIARS